MKLNKLKSTNCVLLACIFTIEILVSAHAFTQYDDLAVSSPMSESVPEDPFRKMIIALCRALGGGDTGDGDLGEKAYDSNYEYIFDSSFAEAVRKFEMIVLRLFQPLKNYNNSSKNGNAKGGKSSQNTGRVSDRFKIEVIVEFPEKGLMIENMPAVLIRYGKNGYDSRSITAIDPRINEVFRYHGLRSMRLSVSTSSFSMIPVIAHLGALKEAGVVFAEGAGFSISRDDIGVRRGAELTVASKDEIVPERSFSVTYRECTMSEKEIMFLKSVATAAIMLDEERLAEAKKQLDDIEEVCRYATVQPHLRRRWNEVLTGLNNAADAKAVEAERLYSNGDYYGAVKILEELYECFRDRISYIQTVNKALERMPFVFKVKMAYDRMSGGEASTTLLEVLNWFGIDSIERFLDKAKSLGEYESAKRYLKCFIEDVYRKSFGAPTSVIDALGYRRGSSARFNRLCARLDVELKSIDLMVVRRLDRSYAKVSAKKRHGKLRALAEEFGYKYLNVFLIAVSKHPEFHEWMRSTIIDVIRRRGRYRPFIAAELGIDNEELGEKIRQYKIDVGAVDTEETARIRCALERIIGNRSFNLRKAIFSLGYRDLGLFKKTYKDDKNVQEVLVSFFRSLLEEYGGNTEYCAIVAHLDRDFLYTWLVELKIDRSTLKYNEGRRLRSVLQSMRESEKTDEVHFVGTNFAEIRCFRIGDAIKKMGWPNLTVFNTQHGDDDEVRSVFRKTVIEVLKITNDNKSSAAELLGVYVNTLSAWIERFNITDEDISLSPAQNLRNALRSLPEENKYRLDLAAQKMGFSVSDNSESVYVFMRDYKDDPEIKALVKEIITSVMIMQGGYHHAVADRIGVHPVTLNIYLRRFGVDEDSLKLLYDEGSRLEKEYRLRGDGTHDLSEVARALGYQTFYWMCRHNADDERFRKTLDGITYQAWLRSGKSAEKAALHLGVSAQFVYRAIGKFRVLDSVDVGAAL